MMNRNNLGTAEILGAEAVGQPGQRRFRLFVRTRSASAIFWLEKEQLRDLSLVIDRLIAQMSEGQILRVEARAGGLPEMAGDLPEDFPLRPDYEMQLGQIRLGIDEKYSRLIMAAMPFDIREDEQGEPNVVLREDEAVSFLFSLDQARNLTSRITFVLNRGRPTCPHCHMPLVEGEPHACAKQNGHHKIIQVILENDEDDK